MSRLAPKEEIGWTHVWDGGAEQVPITRPQELALCLLEMIVWSGIYRVYRCAEGVSLEQVQAAVRA